MKTASHIDVARFVWIYAKRHIWLLSFMVFLMLGNIVVGLIQPFFYKTAIDLMIDTSIEVQTVLQQASLLIIYGILCGVVGLTMHELASYLLGSMEVRIMHDVNSDVFAHVQRLSTKFHVNAFAGATTRKISRGVDGVESMIDHIWFHFLPLIIYMIGLMIVLSIYAPLIGLVMLAGIILYVIVSVSLNIILSKLYIWVDKQDTKVTASMVDAITGNAVVKAFAQESFEDKRHGYVLSEWKKRLWFSWKLGSFFMWIQFMLLMVIELAAFMLALWLWSKGQFTAGGFIVILFYVGDLWGRMLDIGRNTREYLKSVSNAKEMVTIISTPVEIANKPDAEDMIVSKGSISFDHVTFMYENQTDPVFRDFSLNIKPGERIALIGHSGGGKSTIVKLLMRLYDLDTGTISIDGKDIADVTQESLRSLIGVVPQDPILFHRTIAENISYANSDSDMEEVIEAAKKSRASEFIDNLPKGYDTLVGERGVKLSGGERQRVAIARAMLADKPILILDEATSSLDSLSEKYIQEALEYLMEGRTTIVIAHRLSTIKKADRILVIENGQIVEEGPHSTLVNLEGGVYRHLFELQAGGFIGE